jgi:transcriptional regulator with XRE-family HTH domain
MTEQARWMKQLLESSIQRSGLSERDIEERLGWEPGLIARMINGSAEPGPLHLLQILAELGSERDRSRRVAGRETRMVEELIGRFRELGYGAAGATSSAAARLPKDVLEQTVEDVLLGAFGSRFSRKGKQSG